MDLEDLKEKIKQKYVYKLKDNVTFEEVVAKLEFDDDKCMINGINYISKNIRDDVSFLIDRNTREVTIYLDGEWFDCAMDPSTLVDIITLIESGYFHKVPLPLPEDIEKNYKEIMKSLEELKIIFEGRKAK